MGKKYKGQAANVAPTVNNSKKYKRIIIIFVAVFVGAALILGATLGIVSGVINANAVVYYKGVAVDIGVANFLVSRYKSLYLETLSHNNINAVDSELFWYTMADENTTYLENFRENTEAFIRSVVASNKLFDEYTSLDSSTRAGINKSVNEVLELRADGDVRAFNEMAKKYGFDFDDFRRGTEMLYKYEYARDVIFGEDGSGAAVFTAECESYYENYSHVTLLMIRTEDKYAIDDNGNKNYKETIPLTDEEKQEREKRILEVRAAVEGINNGNVAIEQFEQLFKKYHEGDDTMTNTGYYFNAESSYTKEFAIKFNTIVDGAIALEEGKLCEVDTIVGKCFIYKTERAPGAYTNVSDSGPFRDFYKLVASTMYNKMTKEYKSAVEVREAFLEIDLLRIPRNYELVARI